MATHRARGLLCAVGLLFVSRNADADPHRNGARLTWVRGVAADECVGQAGLEEDVKARLGHDPFVLPKDIAIEGAIVRVPEGFRADLVLRDARGKVYGTRQLTSRERHCRALGEAVAVAMTIAIDPNAPGTRVATVEETPPPPAPSPPAPAPRPPPPRARGRASLSVGAVAGLVPTIVPTVDLRAHGSIGERFEVGVGAQYVAEARTAGTGFALTTLSLGACAVPLTSFRAVRWCAAMIGGFLHAYVHAPELSPVDVGTSFWAGAETGPALVVPVAGSLRLEASAQAVAPITRKDVLIRGRTTPAWEQAVIAGRLNIGIGAEF